MATLPIVVVMVVAAFAVMVVSMATLLIMVMVVMTALPIMVMVIMAAALDMVVEGVIQACVVDRMEHHVLQVVLVHIENGAHECEFDLLLRFEGAVVLDPVLQIREVEGDARSVFEGDGGFDVAEEGARLVLHPLAHPQEGFAESRFGIGIPAVDAPGEAYGTASGLLDGCSLMVVLMAVAVVFVAHFIIS